MIGDECTKTRFWLQEGNETRMLRTSWKWKVSFENRECAGRNIHDISEKPWVIGWTYCRIHTKRHIQRFLYYDYALSHSLDFLMPSVLRFINHVSRRLRIPFIIRKTIQVTATGDQVVKIRWETTTVSLFLSTWDLYMMIGLDNRQLLCCSEQSISRVGKSVVGSFPHANQKKFVMIWNT